MEDEIDRYNGVNPELVEVSPWFRDIMSASDDLMSTGISPATAAVIVAMVPITLRILKIVSDAVHVQLSDKRLENERKHERFRDEQRLETKRKEYELEREFSKK